MIRKLVVLSAGLMLCAAFAMAQDKTKPEKVTVEGTSITVYKKLDDKNFPYSGSSTSLSVLVTYPGKQFLGVDNSSKVSEFKDDKGTSLMSTGFFKTQFSTTPNIGKDRTSMVVSVYGNVAPTKGATKISLKGDVVAICGLEPKDSAEKEVTLKEKTEAKIGDFTLTVNQEKGFGGTGASFTITATKPIVKTVTAKDADGKALEVTSYIPYGFGTKWTYPFTLKKVADKAKFTVTYFSKEEKVTIPVDITVGAGL